MGEMDDFKKDLELRNKFRAAAEKEQDAFDDLWMKQTINAAERSVRESMVKGGSRQRVIDEIRKEIAESEKWGKELEGMVNSGPRRLAIAKSQNDLRKIDQEANNLHGDREMLEQNSAKIASLRQLEKHFRDEVAQGKGAFTKQEIDFARKRAAELDKTNAALTKKSSEHVERRDRAREAALEIEERRGIDPTHPIADAGQPDDGTAVAMAEGAETGAVASLMADPDTLDSVSTTDAGSAESQEDPNDLDEVSASAALSESREPVLDTEPQGAEVAATDTTALEPEPAIASVESEPALTEPEEQLSEPEPEAPTFEEPAFEPAVASVEEVEPPSDGFSEAPAAEDVSDVPVA